MQPDPNKTATTATGTTPPTVDELLSTIQTQLLGNSGMVSSDDTNLEKSINAAIDSVKKSKDANTASVEGTYGREIQAAKDKSSSDITTFGESGRGFAVNIGALRELVNTGDKNIKDLEQRKQELLLQGEADAASKISDLQLQEYTLRQDARQKVFQNLLQLGNFATGVQNNQLQQRTQNFAERSAIATLASKYGVPVAENDTIDTIAAKVAPFASESAKLEIAKTKAQINQANAEAAKALRGDSANIDDLTASVLATAFRKGDTAFLANIKDAGTAGKVYNQIEKQRQADVAAAAKIAQEVQASGGNQSDFAKKLQNDPNVMVSPDDVAAISKEVFTSKSGSTKESITHFLDKYFYNRKTDEKGNPL